MAKGPSKTELRRNLEAAIEGVKALAEIIRELGEVPSGLLYSRLMGKVTLDDYNRLIGILKETGLVVETPGHVLRWVKPEQQAEGRNQNG